MLQYEVCRGTKRRVSVKRACGTSCFTLPDTLTLSQPLTLAMLCMQTETEISIVDVLKHGLTLQKKTSAHAQYIFCYHQAYAVESESFKVNRHVLNICSLTHLHFSHGDKFTKHRKVAHRVAKNQETIWLKQLKHGVHNGIQKGHILPKYSL